MKPLFTLLLLVLVFSKDLAAFPNQLTFSVKVTLSDPNGAVISGGLVVIKSKKFKARGYSNEEGSFMIELNPGEYEIELTSGDYEVEIEAHGFKTFKTLELITATRRELKFQLDPLPLPTICEPEDQLIEIKASPLPNTIKPRKIQYKESLTIARFHEFC